MSKLQVSYKHLGRIEYQQAWDYQESLLQQNLDIKKQNRDNEIAENGIAPTLTHNTFLLCEHEPVFTLGKSGDANNLLLQEEMLKAKEKNKLKVNLNPIKIYGLTPTGIFEIVRNNWILFLIWSLIIAFIGAAFEPIIQYFSGTSNFGH